MLNQQDVQWDLFVGGQHDYIYEDNVFAGLAPASGMVSTSALKFPTLLSALLA